MKASRHFIEAVR